MYATFCKHSVHLIVHIPQLKAKTDELEEKQESRVAVEKHAVTLKALTSQQ